eukprot:CAMPEP_0185776558 /NCGR_PEP_ID=MMETSP1174-20130828/86148_1 /TAXON_ID=35687 /ORGANISM="Dictyocha speculum, Strain CCMP1381" /LENGTH=46 /DNA_ID= /DNA_START= /DNA_END= /DNA_ORIENTATION=
MGFISLQDGQCAPRKAQGAAHFGGCKGSIQESQSEESEEGRHGSPE